MGAYPHTPIRLTHSPGDSAADLCVCVCVIATGRDATQSCQDAHQGHGFGKARINNSTLCLQVPITLLRTCAGYCMRCAMLPQFSSRLQPTL
jgi:hypothetical protein